MSDPAFHISARTTNRLSWMYTVDPEAKLILLSLLRLHLNAAIVLN